MTTTKRVHDVPVPAWATLGANVAVQHKHLEKTYSAQVVKITASTVQVIVNDPDGDMKFPEYIAFSRSSRKRCGDGALFPRGWRTAREGWIHDTRLLPASALQEAQEDQQGPEPEDYGALFEASPIRPPENEILNSAAKAAYEAPLAAEIVDADAVELEEDRSAIIGGIHYETETIEWMEKHVQPVADLLKYRRTIFQHLKELSRNAAEDYTTAVPGYEQHHLKELEDLRRALRAIEKLDEIREPNADIPF